MKAGDVVAIVLSAGVAVMVGALAATLVALIRTLRTLREAVAGLHEEAVPLVVELREAVRDAGCEVDHLERLVTSAESLTGAVEVASRLAYRTLASPVVKAMAFGTGVSRGAQRLRAGEDAPPPRRRRRERRSRREPS